MSPFKKASEFSGGTYFKPLEHQADLALLIEPKSLRKDVPYTTFDKKPGTRDEVSATITVFKNSEAIETGVPSEVLKGATVTHGMLVGTLGQMLDSATIVRLDKVTTKGGSGYVFRDVSPQIEEKVVAYYEQREANVSAALDSAPDFD